MALTETRPEAAAPSSGADQSASPRTQPTPVEQVLGSGDHKIIGRVLIGASLVFVASSLLVASLVNLHAASGNDLLEATVANRFGINSPIALLLCGALPLVLGLAFYLVPLQLGSPALAFPRAAALSLWGWLFGAVMFTVALLAKGSYGGSSLKMSLLGHVSVGLLIVSLLVGVVSVMTTVVSHRPAGMTISRVPFFSFSMLVTGAVWLATLPVVLASITVWQIRHPGVGDLELSAFPAIEWVFHQPAIYIAAIPLLGIILDVAGAVSGQRQRLYTTSQGLIIAFGALSFGPWAQSFESRETLLWVASAVIIALPALAALGGAVETLRRGKLVVTGGLVLSVSAILVLLLATVAGALQGLSTVGSGQGFDLVQGAFGSSGSEGVGPGVATGQFYLVIAAVVIGALGAVFHWGSRLVPVGLPKGAGLGLAPLALVGGLAFGLGHVIVGIALPDESGVEALLSVTGIGGIILAVTAYAAFAVFVAGAAGKGAPVDNDAAPESTGGTLEWATQLADVSTVESEYPVQDLRDSTSTEGAN